MGANSHFQAKRGSLDHNRFRATGRRCQERSRIACARRVDDRGRLRSRRRPAPRGMCSNNYTSLRLPVSTMLRFANNQG